MWGESAKDKMKNEKYKMISGARWALLSLFCLLFSPVIWGAGRADPARIVLEDFSQGRVGAFPPGWGWRGKDDGKPKYYVVQEEKGHRYLNAKDDSQSVIIIKKEGISEDALIGDALDAGAEDVVAEDAAVFEIYGATLDLDKIKDALLAKKYAVESAEALMKPDNYVAVDEATAAKVLKLVDALEEYDDVKNVYMNADIPEQVLAKLG